MIGILVRVLGGLGGFYFALATDIYSGWMHVVIQRVMRGCAGDFMRRAEASLS